MGRMVDTLTNWHTYLICLHFSRYFLSSNDIPGESVGRLLLPPRGRVNVLSCDECLTFKCLPPGVIVAPVCEISLIASFILRGRYLTDIIKKKEGRLPLR